MRKLKVFATREQIFYNGVGIYARMVMDRFPNLPVIDDGMLQRSWITSQLHRANFYA